MKHARDSGEVRSPVLVVSSPARYHWATEDPTLFPVNLRLIAHTWFNAHPPLWENLAFSVFLHTLTPSLAAAAR